VFNHKIEIFLLLCFLGDRSENVFLNELLLEDVEENIHQKNNNKSQYLKFLEISVKL